MAEINNTILVIEDEPSIAELVQFVLEEDGFKVVLSDENSYMSDIRQHRPGVILLDHWLQSSYGSSICLEIKTDPTLAQIPVILLSAVLGLSSIAATCKADDYILKPFDIFDLNQTVRKWLKLPGNIALSA